MRVPSSLSWCMLAALSLTVGAKALALSAAYDVSTAGAGHADRPGAEQGRMASATLADAGDTSARPSVPNTAQRCSPGFASMAGTTRPGSPA